MHSSGSITHLAVWKNHRSSFTSIKERSDDLKVAGYWSHARRRFAEMVKASGKNGPSTPLQNYSIQPYAYSSYLLEQLMHYSRNNVPENKLSQ